MLVPVFRENLLRVRYESVTRYLAQYTELTKKVMHQCVKENSQPSLRSLMHRVESLSCDSHAFRFWGIVEDAFQCDS